MASWARKIVKDPNATTPADLQELRDAGLTDSQIFAITTFVGLRLAFSTINVPSELAPTRNSSSVYPQGSVCR